MICETIGRSICCTQHLDVELLQQSARCELRLGQLRLEMVVNTLSTVAVQRLVNAENVDQFIGEPEPGGRSTKKVKMVGEALPDRAVIGFNGCAILGRNTQVFHCHALAVEHPKDIVVGNDKQLGGRAEASIRIGEQRRMDVPMRRNKRQVFDGCVQLPRKVALRWIRIKTAVGRQRPSVSNHYGLPPAHLKCVRAAPLQTAAGDARNALRHFGRKLPDGYVAEP